jgi:hypothetical protein
VVINATCGSHTDTTLRIVHRNKPPLVQLQLWRLPFFWPFYPV